MPCRVDSSCGRQWSDRFLSAECPWTCDPRPALPFLRIPQILVRLTPGQRCALTRRAAAGSQTSRLPPSRAISLADSAASSRRAAIVNRAHASGDLLVNNCERAGFGLSASFQNAVGSVERTTCAGGSVLYESTRQSRKSGVSWQIPRCLQVHPACSYRRIFHSRCRIFRRRGGCRFG